MKNSKVRIYIYQKWLIAIYSLCIWFYEINNNKKQPCSHKYKIFKSIQSKKPAGIIKKNKTGN